MRVLLVHNYYREPGGEDYAFHADCEVLRRGGHEVETFVRSSADTTESMGGVLRTAAGTPWSANTVAALEARLSELQPAVVHFHNTFPLISPAAYYACARAGVPVVQTLHNFRLLCAKADFYRDGGICEECVQSGSRLPAIRHRCYRESTAGTATVAAMQWLHDRLGTWERVVDRYVVLTEFARSKFAQGGLPAEKLHVKPNFLLEPCPAREGDGDAAVFVGRLCEEKGLRTLMSAWQSCELPLRIVGTGPLEPELRAWALSRPHVEVLGWLPRPRVQEHLQRARMLVLPSLWYEGFPIAALEAMSAGVPILASHIGSLAEIVRPEGGGETFPAGDAPALVAAAMRLWSDAHRNHAMGEAGRRAFEQDYDARAGYRSLLRLYEEVAAPQRPVDATRSVWVENTPICDLTLPQTVARIGEWLDEDTPRRVATANLDFLRLASGNRELVRALRTADLVTADGTPVLWLARLRGRRLHERVAGADLILPLMAEVHRRGRSVFLLGGAPGSAEGAAAVLLRSFPGLRIVGTYAPSIDLDDPESCRAAVAVVAEAQPDLLLVALGCPKQDLFLARHLPELRCRVGIGVGASLDFLAGNLKRAPELLRRSGLEWAYRFWQEPGRLGGRYARDFAFLAGAAVRARRAAQHER